MGLYGIDIKYMLHLTRFLTFPAVIREKGEPARHSSTVLSVVTATKGSFEMDRYLVTNSKIVKQYNWPGIYNCTYVVEYFLEWFYRFVLNNKRQPSSAALVIGLSIVFHPHSFSLHTAFKPSHVCTCTCTLYNARFST